MKANLKEGIQIELNEGEAFRILCKALDMECVLDENTKFVIKTNEDKENHLYAVKNGCEYCYDERGDLFVALRNVAVNIFPNTSFRNATYIYNNTSRKGQVFAFKTNELEKDWNCYQKGTEFKHTFNLPQENHYVEDEVIFVTEDYSDVIYRNLFQIERISEDGKSFLFKATGDTVNVHNVEKLNSLLEQLAAED